MQLRPIPEGPRWLQELITKRLADGLMRDSEATYCRLEDNARNEV